MMDLTTCQKQMSRSDGELLRIHREDPYQWRIINLAANLGISEEIIEEVVERLEGSIVSPLEVLEALGSGQMMKKMAKVRLELGKEPWKE